MFITKRKIRRTRSRNILQTELLESRAMFSATEMPQVDDSPIDDSGLDIPACERPYGQDESDGIEIFGVKIGKNKPDDETETETETETNEPESPGTDYIADLIEGLIRINKDTDDLGTGINEPETAEERGPCYADLDVDEGKKRTK